MSRKYKIHHPDGRYFITYSVQGWVDDFTPNEYKASFVRARIANPRQRSN
jgi:hypothetical protein